MTALVVLLTLCFALCIAFRGAISTLCALARAVSCSFWAVPALPVADRFGMKAAAFLLDSRLLLSMILLLAKEPQGSDLVTA